MKFIHHALRQREEARVDEKDWVVDEAMNPRKLQNGGTFRNVLARRIDEAITPFFAKIISCIDQNCNLDLLAEPKQQTSTLSQFWLAMFKLIKIDFSESVAKGRTTLLVKSDFHCHFPFSWIVKEAIDTLWGKSHVSVSAKNSMLLGMYIHLCLPSSVWCRYPCYLFGQ